MSKKNIGVIATLLILPVLAFSTLNGCAHLGYRETTGRYVDDSAITLEVKRKLLVNHSIKSLPITVRTFKGDVELTGFVDNSAQKRLATELAGSVHGASHVTNKLVVRGKKG